jgi:penicillin amidase
VGQEWLSAAGLSEPAEILVDRWGVPHIHAASLRDAFFAQGFNAARDRLWQMDLWRRAGLGRLAEALGPEHVERDRAARLFLYRGSMEEEWQAYGCDLREMLVPFVDGINEYVRLVAQRPQLLPPEFELLGYAPAEWSAEEVLRIRGHGRYRNLRSEVARAQILHRFGPSAERLRARLEPHTEIAVPEGLDLSLITADVLRAYDQATTPPFAPPGAGGSVGDGSNNWVLAGSRTASGRPILANDPHRVLSLPSLRYLAQVACPELNVVGGGEPMLPGVSVGHNGRVAFGFTILPIDQEDLYVYEVDGSGCRYRYGSGWEAMTVERERIEVRDGDPVGVELRFTRHGPVVHELPERGAAFAVRAAWLQPGMVPYLGSLALLQAENWEQFRSAARHWGGPGENLVYADVEGKIGWQPVGRVPVRRNWTGLLPVPGDGRFEWAGCLEHGGLPHEQDPGRGWIATANQFNVEPASADGVDLAFEWDPPYRQRRIAEVLERSARHAIEDLSALQSDYLCLAATEVVPMLRDLVSKDPRVRRALALLSAWDCRLEADSAAAALFELWFRDHLRRALFTDALIGQIDASAAALAVDALLGDESVPRDARIDVGLLRESLATDAQATAAVMQRTLREAMLALERLLGPDVSRWRWGSLHQAHFVHPLADRGEGMDSVGPAPRGGGHDTVGNASYGPRGFMETAGATLRLTMDVGDWDRSQAMNAPGQSGDPRSDHYSDLMKMWSEDMSIPLLYSREAVEAEARKRLTIEPTVRTSADGGAAAAAAAGDPPPAVGSVVE